LKLLL